MQNKTIAPDVLDVRGTITAVGYIPRCRIAWMHFLVAPGKSVALLTQDGNGLQCSTDDANATATAAATANAAASATGTTLFAHGLLHENTLLRSSARRHQVFDDYSMIITCFRMIQNASECFTMLQTASKCFRMLQNA